MILMILLQFSFNLHPLCLIPSSQMSPNSRKDFWNLIHKEDRQRGKSYSSFPPLPYPFESTLQHRIISKNRTNVCIYIHWRGGDYKRVSRHIGKGGNTQQRNVPAPAVGQGCSQLQARSQKGLPCEID